REERRPGVPAKSKISWGGRWPGERGPHAVGMQRSASGAPTKPASWGGRWAPEVRSGFSAASLWWGHGMDCLGQLLRLEDLALLISAEGPGGVGDYTLEGLPRDAPRGPRRGPPGPRREAAPRRHELGRPPRPAAGAD